MKLGNLLLALVAVPLVGCSEFGGPSVVGTGPDKKDPRTVGDFKKIQISNAIQATITVDGKNSVEIDAKESLLPLVTTKVEGDELVIETTKPIDSSTPVKAIIHVASLEALKVSGASGAEVSGVEADKFTLHASGASHVTLDGAIKSLSAEASGASELELTGKADVASVEASGASTLKLAKLTIGALAAEASGASTVAAGKLESLDANASGASNIQYESAAKVIRSESSGASSIKSP
jgi:hypothetical protein